MHSFHIAWSNITLPRGAKSTNYKDIYIVQNWYMLTSSERGISRATQAEAERKGLKDVLPSIHHASTAQL